VGLQARYVEVGPAVETAVFVCGSQVAKVSGALYRKGAVRQGKSGDVQRSGQVE
jgi:hypothetical protein